MQKSTPRELFIKARNNIRTHCYNKNSKQYHLYGALGYTMCEEWKNKTKYMYIWALKNGWKPGYYISIKRGFKEFNPHSAIILPETRRMFHLSLRQIEISKIKKAVKELDLLSTPPKIFCPKHGIHSELKLETKNAFLKKIYIKLEHCLRHLLRID